MIHLPPTRRGDAVDELFGQSVPDPYRWLENDARQDAEVAAWVTTQNDATLPYLAALPGREVFRARLRALFDHERVSVPYRRGGRYFHTRHSGLANQARLVVRESLCGPERVLIDPNTWSEDGATALGEWEPSRDGAHLAYTVQEGGTDWRTIRVLNVWSGEVLEDKVEWARFTGISWTEGGFFYSRYPETAPQDGVANHAVWFHALGTPQSQDRLVHATPDRPHLVNVAGVTDDGRYLLLVSTPGAGRNALAVIDLATPDWKPRHLVENLDDEWLAFGNVGTRFFLATSQGAERRKIVTLDLAEPDAAFRDLVPEQDSVLTSIAIVGQRLIARYLVDARTELRRHRLDGTPDGLVALPGIGTAGGFRGEPDSDETFFAFTSYNAPTTVYRYDVATNTSEVWAEPRTGFDPDSITVEQRFCASRDGTRIPLFVIRRKDATGAAPTILYGYGGFGISMIPYFSPTLLAWVEQGGAYAVACLRGGGEYGRAWHEAGQRGSKQNVFDDFIAAAEYLKAEGIAAPDGLAIQGESNGGLLVGAVVNQRPDLFAVGLAGVGVMDMLRFNQFTGGALWMEDFGDPAKEGDFRNLLAYSPYHNLRPGRDYPAILVTTADTDDRVVPGHSFKYAAALQAAEIGEKPHLIRIETRAGHGAGKPMDKIVEEAADLWAFAARWTGLKPR